jgi:hypothetical protein
MVGIQSIIVVATKTASRCAGEELGLSYARIYRLFLKQDVMLHMRARCHSTGQLSGVGIAPPNCLVKLHKSPDTNPSTAGEAAETNDLGAGRTSTNPSDTHMTYKEMVTLFTHWVPL